MIGSSLKEALRLGCRLGVKFTADSKLNSYIGTSLKLQWKMINSSYYWLLTNKLIKKKRQTVCLQYLGWRYSIITLWPWLRPKASTRPCFVLIIFHTATPFSTSISYTRLSLHCSPFHGKSSDDIHSSLQPFKTFNSRSRHASYTGSDHRHCLRIPLIKSQFHSDYFSKLLLCGTDTRNILYICRSVSS